MAPAAAVASRPASASTGRASGAEVDLVRSYLRDIGRVPLLSHQQEITLGRQVQELMDLEALEAELKDQRGGEEVAREEWAKAAGVSAAQLKRKLQAGRRAKERMVAANLRLVVSVAKKYTKRNMELLDLIQEGTIGLVRGVEKFDPTRGYKFSTYAYWWIRQGHHACNCGKEPHDSLADSHHRDVEQAEKRPTGIKPRAGPHPIGIGIGLLCGTSRRGGEGSDVPGTPACEFGDEGG